MKIDQDHCHGAKHYSRINTRFQTAAEYHAGHRTTLRSRSFVSARKEVTESSFGSDPTCVHKKQHSSIFGTVPNAGSLLFDQDHVKLVSFGLDWLGSIPEGSLSTVSRPASDIGPHAFIEIV
jgi:hypothetical protein